MKKVLIVYHYVAHYRYSIFKRLIENDNENIDYFIAASSISNQSSIKTINPESDLFLKDRWLELKNIWLSNNILWQKGLIKEVMASKYDAIIFLGNMYYISTWVAALLAKIKGTKSYMWTHGILKEERGLKWFLRKSFYGLSDGLFLYGNNAKNLMEIKGFFNNRLHVIYNSLDYELQSGYYFKFIESRSSLRNDLGFDNHEIVIIYTGRITVDKKLSDALRLLKYSKISGFKYRFFIVGDGPYLDELKILATKFEIDKSVIFYGSCYDEELLAKFIICADVMFVPGDVGLTAIHSLTYGTPVVTHNNFESHKPEHEAIVEDVSGSFVDINDDKSVLAALDKWSMRKKLSPIAVSNNCREIIGSRYNADHQKNIINNTINRDIYFV
jgi:glycosyltransferase involved in cell wall biosynthesis